MQWSALKGQDFPITGGIWTEAREVFGKVVEEGNQASDRKGGVLGNH